MWRVVSEVQRERKGGKTEVESEKWVGKWKYEEGGMYKCKWRERERERWEMEKVINDYDVENDKLNGHD